ncbi:HK97 family phage prohead protease [Frankia sp. Mgl5]|nr:HK97 family phage prohead protease [Frankia sp. Mgl5]
MRTKAFRISRFKAAGDGEPEGTFDALVSVFGNVDLGGDRIVKGAFARTLGDWSTAGDPIPVIWSHQWDNPDAHIGYVDPAEAVETDEGLAVKGRLDVGEPFAGKVYDLLKTRRVREFSFAYDIPAGGDRKAADGAHEIVDIDLLEVGPTLKGMNPDTVLGDVKSFRSRGGRGAKATVRIEGSAEQHLEAIGGAVRAWAAEYRVDDVYAAYVEATFDDHVIAYVESWDEPYGGGTYYDIPYTAGANGVELGEPTAVAIVGAVQPKAHRRAAKLRQVGTKAGARNSVADLANLQTIHDLSSGLGAACAEPDGTAAAEPDAPAEDGKRRRLSAGDQAALLGLELAAL